jgi:hypothetical protein
LIPRFSSFASLHFKSIIFSKLRSELSNCNWLFPLIICPFSVPKPSINKQQQQGRLTSSLTIASQSPSGYHRCEDTLTCGLATLPYASFSACSLARQSLNVDCSCRFIVCCLACEDPRLRSAQRDPSQKSDTKVAPMQHQTSPALRRHMRQQTSPALRRHMRRHKTQRRGARTDEQQAQHPEHTKAKREE